MRQVQFLAGCGTLIAFKVLLEDPYDFTIARRSQLLRQCLPAERL
jgi:hypothetical protein